MNEYVCVNILNVDNQVLLVHREKDPYKGHLNLIGGKVEQFETSEQAARRELLEEAGIEANNFKCRGLVEVPTGSRVWFFNCEYWFQAKESTEKCTWYRLPDILHQSVFCFDTYWKIVPNLKIIIPLLMSGAPEWHAVETSPNELVMRGWKP